MRKCLVAQLDTICAQFSVREIVLQTAVHRIESFLEKHIEEIPEGYVGHWHKGAGSILRRYDALVDAAERRDEAHITQHQLYFDACEKGGQYT